MSSTRHGENGIYVSKCIIGKLYPVVLVW